MDKNVSKARQAQKPNSYLVSDEAYVKYLKENSLPPEEYVIEKLKTHNLVMLGEDHWIDAPAQFISESIKKISDNKTAQLDYVAIEFSSTAQQHLADEFIDSPEYREELVIQILRDGPDFIGWGYQEVLEIFKTVWKENKNHPRRKPVGFDLSTPLFAINAIEFFGYWKGRDWAAFVLPYLKDLTIDHMFDGYIFLKPLGEYRGATIIPGYFDDVFFREVQRRSEGLVEFPTKKDLYEFLCKLRPVLRKPQNLENVLREKPSL